MKSAIKCFLNTFGIIFMIIGMIDDCHRAVGLLFYIIGLVFYTAECYWSIEDLEKQGKKIEKMENKIEESEEELHKEESKTDVNLEDVPMNYDEYLKRKEDSNGKTL